MKYYDVVQGERDWFDLRLGRPTASEFKRILTPKTLQEGGPGAKSYIRELIGEVLNPILAMNAPCYMSRPMLHGRNTEPEARRYYSMERDVDVANGGFCTTDDGRLGASPDGVIGLRRLENGDSIDGAVELKCPMPANHLRYLETPNEVPAIYKWQCHGHMIVTGAAWVDFLSYCDGFAPVLVRVVPNEDTDKLRVALDRFYEQYVAALERVRGK
jgi:hypothetical protein